MSDLEENVARIQGMLQRLGLIGPGVVEKVADNLPMWSFKKGSATVYITAGVDTVIVSSKILERAPPGDVELLRRLLQVNVFMKGAFFAVEDNRAVFLYQIYPTDGLEDEVLGFVVANVAEHADRFDDIIQGRAWEKKT
jgi:hypothetical protein